MQAYVWTAFGRVQFVETKETHPGIRCRCCIEGLDRRGVDLKMRSMTASGSSVPDSTGSPLHVSAMINYIVSDPVKNLYSVNDAGSFIENQMFEVIRRVCSKFRYKSTDPEEVTLLEDSHLIAREMCELLRKRVEVCGVKILRMNFT